MNIITTHHTIWRSKLHIICCFCINPSLVVSAKVPFMGGIYAKVQKGRILAIFLAIGYEYRHYSANYWHLSTQFYLVRMWYCGRKVMGRYISCCGPNSSANCHACRVLRNDIVQKQKDKGKWQGSDWLVLLQELFWTNRLVSWRILWPKQWTPMPWMKKHTDTLNLIACDWFV